MRRWIAIGMVIIATTSLLISIQSKPIYETKEMRNYIVGQYENGTRWERIDRHNISVIIGYEKDVNAPMVIMSIILLLLAKNVFIFGVRDE